MTPMQFDTDAARQAWTRFRRNLNWANRSLPHEDQQEALAEASAHIRDAMATGHGDELARLTAAISGFGPLTVAPPVWQLPLAVTLHYAAILVIGVTGFCLTILMHMGIMDLINPDAVGLWIYTEGDWALSYEAQPAAREILGFWFLPAIIATISIIGGGLYALWRVALAPGGPVARWLKQ
jgi:hypothetical protein